MRRLSQILMLAGLACLFYGGQVGWQSYYGQQQARLEWASSRPTPIRTALETRVHTTTAPALDQVLARLVFPRLEQERFVIAGATVQNLARGPAWLAASNLPGEPGDCLIAGHRDTHFRLLKDVREGDELLVDYGSRRFRYQIVSLAVVAPRQVQLLTKANHAVLTLVTCYPFFYTGRAPKRFLVRARLLEEQANHF
jgi:sortase A